MLKTILFLFSITFSLGAFTQAINITPEKREKESDVKSSDSILLEDLKSLDYPELQVVPRASERLAMESSNIKENGLLTIFPYVLSSAFTTASGFAVSAKLRTDLSEQDRTDAKTNANLAMGIGIGGLAISYWYIYTDHYGATVSQIKSIKGKDRRTDLLKERLAEETFEKSSDLISRWKWVFASANLLGCLQLTGKSTGDNNVLPTLGAIASLLPLFITSSFESNYQKQQEYKKRIYIPISWIDYSYNSTAVAWNPTLNFSWSF